MNEGVIKKIFSIKDGENQETIFNIRLDRNVEIDKTEYNIYCNVKKVYTVLQEDNSPNKFVKYSELNDREKKKAESFEKVFGDKVEYNMSGVPTAFDEILKVVK